MESVSTIEVFRHEDDGGEFEIGMVIVNPSIVEYGDELTPGCLMTLAQARDLAAALTELISL